MAKITFVFEDKPDGQVSIKISPPIEQLQDIGVDQMTGAIFYAGQCAKRVQEVTKTLTQDMKERIEGGSLIWTPKQIKNLKF